MLQWETIETARIADGSAFVLARHGDEWVVRVEQQLLMSNRMHDSEIALAQRSIAQVDDPRSVLVGGLGLGYTLRAALDCVPAEAEVTVVELVPELIEWNRKHLGALNQQPLDDPRCRVVVGDVFDLIKHSTAAFDVILLDVDNGPQALAQARNQRIYGDSGVRACHAALRPGGIVGIWSRGPNARYERTLRRGSFEVEMQRVPARIGTGARHVLFLAKPLPAAPHQPRPSAPDPSVPGAKKGRRPPLRRRDR
jgi:spermidine synthase